jgi:Zn-finger nucleic acid-binding protein
MFCPNDNGMLHHTSVPSHYGQKVIIDQCEDCGGLWFDAFELYRVKPDADDCIKDLNSHSLRAPTDITNSTLRCPRDKTVLSQFRDSRFPSGIILMRCSKCQGFWLNRGEFTKFQQARETLKAPGEKSLEDERLDQKVQQLLASHRAGSSSDVLAKAGAFLSTPVGMSSVGSNSSSQELGQNENHLNTILNVLTMLLRLFIFRF